MPPLWPNADVTSADGTSAPILSSLLSGAVNDVLYLSSESSPAWTGPVITDSSSPKHGTVTARGRPSPGQSTSR
ncbi:hypothetical protein NDU88_007342 [Pleurodeles waltl]|uniref:Uncharacterized protein n=1 Tax=Pleurodeles waltl TaxID=8319 RepID=A0AAV7N1T4_PLEWA|nr:hypothetical protein NDU88_007342 [Pleurodeles waltl]